MCHSHLLTVSILHKLRRELLKTNYFSITIELRLNFSSLGRLILMFPVADSQGKKMYRQCGVQSGSLDQHHPKKEPVFYTANIIPSSQCLVIFCRDNGKSYEPPKIFRKKP